MTKGLIQQEEIMLINAYAQNVKVPGYVKQLFIDLRRDIDFSIRIVGTPNTSPTSMDRSASQKLNKEATAHSHNRQMNCIDVCRTFHPKDTKYTFFVKAMNLLQQRSYYRS